MSNRKHCLILTICVSTMSFICNAQAAISDAAAATGVTIRDLEERGIAGDWRSYNGDYTGRRYTSLEQITPGNVGQLQAQWVFHSRNAGILEVTPLVVGGIMYVTASN